MPDSTTRRLRLSALRKTAPTALDFRPKPEDTEAMRERLALSALRKVRLSGEIAPDGKADWVLTGNLGATVVQPCSVTLEPVTTRIEEPLQRRYTPDFSTPSEGEVEMPEDDTLEPLPETIDLLTLAEEALAIAVPPFPRAQGVDPLDVSAVPPGGASLDAEVPDAPSPFAALEGLKRTLEE